jgi:two-component system, sensor histidine kinase and response regulator
MERMPTKILLVEDDEEDYVLLQKLLAKIPNARYELQWESSYAAGLAYMLECRHDLCLLDYRLGKQNGIELVREARRQGYVRPIILLTGASEDEIDIQALQAGADDYIAKDQLQGVLLHRVIRYAIERKKAEHEREKLLREQIASRELEKRRNEFINMVVHELKTPLTSLKGYAQLLHRRCAKTGDDQTLQVAKRMDIQVNKLTELVDDFQDVTRLAGGKLHFNEDDFSFDALVEEIVEELQLTTQQQQIRREGETHKMVWGDRRRIGQVITNFLTNAMKYAPMTDCILVKTSSDTRTVTLCVQDFGPGISKAEQVKVFDPFYRIEDPAQKGTPGLGMGLHIAAEIIKGQDGQIWVESEEGQGARFYFTLPLDRKQSPALQEQMAPEGISG